MSKPILVDAFCGAGGATKGYQRAGFHVVGIDHRPQPHYCGDDFIEADALKVLASWLQTNVPTKPKSQPRDQYANGVTPSSTPEPEFHPSILLPGFDAIHASPPCQAYSAGKNMWKGRLSDERHPDLVDATRELLRASGLPYVMENVVGAPLTNYVTLCGDMFELGVKRHRLFETSFMIWNPPVCRSRHPDFFVSVFGGGAKARKTGRGFPKTNVIHEQASKAMGIDWMTRDEMSQAIPPAYCEWIGARLLEQMESVA